VYAFRGGESHSATWLITRAAGKAAREWVELARLNKIGFVWHTPLPYRPTAGPGRISAQARGLHCDLEGSPIQWLSAAYRVGQIELTLSSRIKSPRTVAHVLGIQKGKN